MQEEIKSIRAAEDTKIQAGMSVSHTKGVKIGAH